MRPRDADEPVRAADLSTALRRNYLTSNARANVRALHNFVRADPQISNPTVPGSSPGGRAIARTRGRSRLVAQLGGAQAVVAVW